MDLIRKQTSSSFARNVSFIIKRDNIRVWDQSNHRRYQYTMFAPIGFVFPSTGFHTFVITQYRNKGDRKDSFHKAVYNFLSQGLERLDLPNSK